MNAFPLDKATPSQKEVMAYVHDRIVSGERGFVYWLGGVRSGKSFGTAMAFMEHQSHRRDANYLILAYTQTQALTIYGAYFRTIGEAMGLDVKVTSGAKARISIPETGNVFLVKGADSEGRDKAIQGLTVAGLIADETVLLNRQALHQAEARVSDNGALRIYTSNKANEYHWTSKYYLKRIKSGAIAGKVVDSVVADNSHVAADYVAERSAEYTGDTLTRFIDNEFTLEGRPLYDIRLGIKKDRGYVMVTIYGHPAGFEILVSSVGSLLMFTDAVSLDIGEDPIKWIREHVPQCWRLLLNGDQPLLARRARRYGISVKSYREHYMSSYNEVLARACARKLVWVDPKHEGLVEAIRTYYRPGEYQFPMVRAVEATGMMLRSLLLTNDNAPEPVPA